MNTKISKLKSFIGLASMGGVFAIACTSCSTPPMSTVLSATTKPVASEISTQNSHTVSYALVIANDDYSPPVEEITTAATDAESLELTLKEYVYNVNVKVEPDVSNIGDIKLRIERFVKKINNGKKPPNLLIFAYSGHAELEADGSQSLIMVNGDHYPLSELVRTLASHDYASSTKHVLLLNCCRNKGATPKKKWSCFDFFRRSSTKRNLIDVDQVFTQDMQAGNFLVSFPVRKGSKTDVGKIDYASIGNSTLAGKNPSPYIAAFCSALMDSPGKSDFAVLESTHRKVREIKFPEGRPNTFNPELAKAGNEPIFQTGLITPKSYEEWRTNGNVDVDPVTNKRMKRDVRLHNLGEDFSKLPGLNFELHKIEIPEMDLNCPMRFLDHTLDTLSIVADRAKKSETPMLGLQILAELEQELERRLKPYGLSRQLSRDEVIELAELVLQGFRPWINAILKSSTMPTGPV